MSEIKNIEDEKDDSMEPGELEVTPPGTPTQNVEENSKTIDNDKNDSGNGILNKQNAETVSSSEVLKTYQDHEDERLSQVPDMTGNPFFNGSFPRPNAIMMSSRGFPLFRPSNRGINIKARLGFRGSHRGSFFPGRGRGYANRISSDLRDFQEVKQPFKMKLMYTKTKPSLSWHPNSKNFTFLKLDTLKVKTNDFSQNEINKTNESEDLLKVKKNEKNQTEDENKNESKQSLDIKSKTNKTRLSKDRESKKKCKSISKEKTKNEKRNSERRDSESETFTKKKISDQKYRETVEFKSSNEISQKEKSSSDKNKFVKHIMKRSKDRSRNTKTPERSRKSKKKSYKQDTKTKQEYPEKRRSISKSKDNSKENKIEKLHCKDKNNSLKSKTEIERNVSEEEFKTKDNKAYEKKYKKVDIFDEYSPKTPEPLESTTPVIAKLSISLKIDKPKETNSKGVCSSFLFPDDLYSEEPENAFPLTKDGTIQAVEENNEQSKVEDTNLQIYKTDELDTNSSPDTEDYQDMWEEDEDLLTSSQIHEINRTDNIEKSKINEEVLKNIKIEIDDELEMIKKNQNVIENEIFKNLGSDVNKIKIKQERLSTDVKFKIKKEKTSDDSCSSSDESSSSSSNENSSCSSTSSTESEKQKNIKACDEDDIRDGFSTQLFVNPSPPPEFANTIVKNVIPPPSQYHFKDSLNSSRDIKDPFREKDKAISYRNDLYNSSIKTDKSFVSPKQQLPNKEGINSSFNTSFANITNNSNECNSNTNTNQKFVIAMQDIYEQFLQSVTNAGVDLSCDNEQKSPSLKNVDIVTQKSIREEIDTKEMIIKENILSDNKSEAFDPSTMPTIELDIPKTNKFRNIIPLDEINIPQLNSIESKPQINNVHYLEPRTTKFVIAGSPKFHQIKKNDLSVEKPLIEKSEKSVKSDAIKEKSPESSTESTSSSSESEDSDSDTSSSTSSESDTENPRSILGVDIEALEKFSTEDRKNLKGLEKRLNTLQGWSAVDEDDKEVFKGLKNILEREIEFIIRKYIPLGIEHIKPPIVEVKEEKPKEEKPKTPPPAKLKPITITPPKPLITSKKSDIFDSKNEPENKFVLSGNKFTFPFPTIFSIGAEMAKNNAAAIQNALIAASIAENAKPKQETKKSTSKPSSKSDYDSKRRRSKSPSDRSHKSSSKRNTHSPMRKSPSKHSSKDSKRERSKSPHSRLEDRRKSSPHHKTFTTNRRSRADSPSKKRSSPRNKHRRSSSISRSTPRRSRSPGNGSQSKRHRARTPTPTSQSKSRGHDKTTKSVHGRKSELHRSRSFSRSRSRSVSSRDTRMAFRARGRIRGSISPIRGAFSPRRSSFSPGRLSKGRRSISPKGRNFSRSPIPFRPPSPSVSPPPSGNDSSRSPKRHSRSLSRSRTRSRSLSPHLHKIRRLEGTHQHNWNIEDTHSNNQYCSESSYGYATSPSRLNLNINNEIPRHIDTVIGSRVGNDSYQPYSQYSGYDYINSQSSNMLTTHYQFDFINSGASGSIYSANENSEYYYNSDQLYQDNRNYMHMNQVDIQDPRLINSTKTIAVQKGNVLEIVPSAVLPDSSTSITIETQENLNLVERTNELNYRLEMKKDDSMSLTQNPVEQKKKKVPSWKREVSRRQMLSAVLKLNRDSDGTQKSILAKGEEQKPKEKKRVLFADGIKPGNGPNDEKSTVCKKEKKPKKEKRERKKSKLALEDKENANLKNTLNIDLNIDPELENAPPPPPPSGSPPPHLQQPIHLRPESPPDFTYFHFDGAVNCMYFSKNPMPIPPRLLNGSFPSPPQSNQQNTTSQIQQSIQQQNNQEQLQHQIQTRPHSASSLLILQQQQQRQQILNQASNHTASIGSNTNIGNNQSNQFNVLSSISNASERTASSLLVQNHKISSPVQIIPTHNLQNSPHTPIRYSTIQRVGATSHFVPNNISMSSCNFSIPPPNIVQPLSSIEPQKSLNILNSLQNQKNYIQSSENFGMQQPTPTLEQIKRATAALPFQSSIQASSHNNLISPVIVTGTTISTESNINSPAFSSDSCFWKNKDNPNTSQTSTNSIISSPLVGSQSNSIQKIIKNEPKLTNPSPNVSPGQNKN